MSKKPRHPTKLELNLAAMWLSENHNLLRTYYTYADRRVEPLLDSLAKFIVLVRDES